MIEHLVPRILAKLLIPFILLFGLYVQFHGDFGPGGGFQAGVIFAAGIILYALIYGLDQARGVITPGFVSILVALGLLIYAGVGVATLLLGGEFLNYGVLDSHDPVHGQHLGILIIEFGVGTTVAAVMITIFYQFAGRLQITRELESDDPDDTPDTPVPDAQSSDAQASDAQASDAQASDAQASDAQASDAQERR